MSRITLGSNITSLRAQRQLAESTSRVSTSLERLSSGLRINHASDDAAGLSIAETLSNHTRVYQQGVRNLNDGISLINIADGALDQLSGITTRLKELAEQSSNGTLGPSQRKSLDAEAQALSKEFTRIVRSTKFNGRLLFDDSFGKLTLQAGFGSSGGITSGLGGAVGTGELQVSSQTPLNFAADMVVSDFNGDGNQDYALINSSSAMVIQLGNGDGTFRLGNTYTTGGGVAFGKAGDVNGDGIMDIIASSGTRAYIFTGKGDGTFNTAVSYASGKYSTAVDVNGDGKVDLVSTSNFNLSVALGNGDGSFSAPVAYANSIPLTQIAVQDFNGDGIPDVAYGQTISNSIRISLGNGDGSFRVLQNFSTPGGMVASSVQAGDFNGDGIYDLAFATYGGTQVAVLIGNSDGSFKASTTPVTASSAIGDIVVGDFSGDGLLDIAASDYITGDVNILLGAGDGSFSAARTFNFIAGGLEILTIKTGDFNNDGVPDIVGNSFFAGRAIVGLGVTVDGVAPLLPFSLKTSADARQALSQFDHVLRNLSLQRGTLGAFSSRLQTAVAVARETSDNYITARSRIVDADVAQETSQLARTQILQQASRAVLAQANQEPRLVLTLLNQDDAQLPGR